MAPLCRIAGLAVLALALHGCGTAPPPGKTTAPAAAGAPRGSTSLAVERHWLQSWFKDTPVRIAQRGNGDVAVDVPLKYCFDPGAAKVLPPLGAVLDKFAQSLQRVPQSRAREIAAPADVAGDPALGLKRSHAVRDALLARGVAAARLDEATLTSAPAVQLLLSLAQP